jgi:hypothetical protein
MPINVGEIIYTVRADLTQMETDLAALSKRAEALIVKLNLKIDQTEIDSIYQSITTQLSRPIKINLDFGEAEARAQSVASLFSGGGTPFQGTPTPTAISSEQVAASAGGPSFANYFSNGQYTVKAKRIAASNPFTASVMEDDELSPRERSALGRESAAANRFEERTSIKEWRESAATKDSGFDIQIAETQRQRNQASSEDAAMKRAWGDPEKGWKGGADEESGGNFWTQRLIARGLRYTPALLGINAIGQIGNGQLDYTRSEANASSQGDLAQAEIARGRSRFDAIPFIGSSIYDFANTVTSVGGLSEQGVQTTLDEAGRNTRATDNVVASRFQGLQYQQAGYAAQLSRNPFARNVQQSQFDLKQRLQAGARSDEQAYDNIGQDEDTTSFGKQAAFVGAVSVLTLGAGAGSAAIFSAYNPQFFQSDDANKRNSLRADQRSQIASASRDRNADARFQANQQIAEYKNQDQVDQITANTGLQSATLLASGLPITAQRQELQGAIDAIKAEDNKPQVDQKGNLVLDDNGRKIYTNPTRDTRAATAQARLDNFNNEELPMQERSVASQVEVLELRRHGLGLESQIAQIDEQTAEAIKKAGGDDKLIASTTALGNVQKVQAYVDYNRTSIAMDGNNSVLAFQAGGDSYGARMSGIRSQRDADLYQNSDPTRRAQINSRYFLQSVGAIRDEATRSDNVENSILGIRDRTDELNLRTNRSPETADVTGIINRTQESIRSVNTGNVAQDNQLRATLKAQGDAQLTGFLRDSNIPGDSQTIGSYIRNPFALNNFRVDGRDRQNATALAKAGIPKGEATQTERVNLNTLLGGIGLGAKTLFDSVLPEKGGKADGANKSDAEILATLQAQTPILQKIADKVGGVGN